MEGTKLVSGTSGLSCTFGAGLGRVKIAWDVGVFHLSTVVLLLLTDRSLLPPATWSRKDEPRQAEKLWAYLAYWTPETKLLLNL